MNGNGCGCAGWEDGGYGFDCSVGSKSEDAWKSDEGSVIPLAASGIGGDACGDGMVPDWWSHLDCTGVL